MLEGTGCPHTGLFLIGLFLQKMFPFKAAVTLKSVTVERCNLDRQFLYFIL